MNYGEDMLERAKEKMTGSRRKPGRRKKQMMSGGIYMGDTTIARAERIPATESIASPDKLQFSHRKLRDYYNI